MKELILKYGLVGIALLLLSALTIQSILKAKTAANDVMAQAILRKIANTLENYYAAHRTYTSSLESFVISEKPFFLKAYFEGVHSGFTFDYAISEESYTVTAAPASSSSGTRTYTIVTGGQFR